MNGAKKGKHVVVDQLFRIGHAAVGLVAVVELADFDGAPAHAPLGIEQVEVELGPGVKLDAELCSGPGESRRLAEHDAFFLRLRGVEAGHQGSTGGDGELATVEGSWGHGTG